MIDFQRWNECHGGPFRYLGRRSISPTQILRAAGIWIFSTRIVRLLLVLIVQLDFVLAQKITIWVCKVIRIVALCVYVCVVISGCATWPGHGSSGAASRPGAASRRRILRKFLFQFTVCVLDRQSVFRIRISIIDRFSYGKLRVYGVWSIVHFWTYMIVRFSNRT